MSSPVLKATTVFFFITLFACASKPNISPTPKWISDPGEGAVGSSTTHVRGRHYQEDLAIARARERLAARYGVEVSSIQTIKEKVVNDRSFVTSVKQIDQQVNKTVVKAQVRSIWRDKERDEIWVWIYPVSN